MNRTTVKRGIGAVILALIAAALLALLLKDKAAQRQDVVDMALPGTTDGSIESSGSSTRLPQLSTDNSGNGTVIAQAGQEAVSNTASTATEAVAQTGTSVKDAASNAAGNVIASAAAVGATATAAVAATGDAAGDTAQKTIDFSVRAPQKASEEFRELDLVNNGEATAPDATAAVATATQSAQTAVQQTTTAAAPAKPDQGTVIASTSARKSTSSGGGGQARLIDEKKSSAPRSSRTTQVVRKSTPAAKPAAKPTPKAVPKPAPAPKAAPAPSTQAKNGYAIQLLATSSSSRANDLKNVMAGEGYPTYVTRTQQNGKLLYRVRIGQYSKRSAAASAQAAMKRRYKKNTYVNRSAIVAR